MATKQQAVPLLDVYPNAFINANGNIEIPGVADDGQPLVLGRYSADHQAIEEVGGIHNPYGAPRSTGGPTDTDELPEGQTNLYFTQDRVAGKADEDDRFSLITTDDPAAPASAVRGGINWRYETAPGTGDWTLKPGRSVMFTSGSKLLVASDVQEGDIFGIYINPPSATTRIALSTDGAGIDSQSARRYTKGNSLVVRYTLYPAYTDANNNPVPAKYGLQTIQQTTQGAVTNRGPHAVGTYYLVNDLVGYQGALYLRQVEGSDSAFDPTKWDGGGAAPHLVNTTVLRFDKNYVHTPISSGTFTVDLTGKIVGRETVAYLTATASDPTANLSATDFQLLSGVYKAGADLMYTFRVGGNGRIHYIITELS